MTDDEFDFLWRELKAQCRAIEVEALKALHARPSPDAPSLDTISTNAVLMDGMGHSREMNLPDFRPEYLVPMPNPMNAAWNNNPVVTRITYRVAHFRLSSISDGRAVYRLAAISGAVE